MATSTHRTLQVRLNHDENSTFRAVSVAIQDMKKLSILLQCLCEDFGFNYTRDVRLYNLTGLLIDDEDVDFIQDGDELYLEMMGRDFDMAQVID